MKVVEISIIAIFRKSEFRILIVQSGIDAWEKFKTREKNLSSQISRIGH